MTDSQSQLRQQWFVLFLAFHSFLLLFPFSFLPMYLPLYSNGTLGQECHNFKKFKLLAFRIDSHCNIGILIYLTSKKKKTKHKMHTLNARIAIYCSISNYRKGITIVAALTVLFLIFTNQIHPPKNINLVQQKNQTITITPRDLLNHHDCLKPIPQPILGINDLNRILVMGMPKCGTSSLTHMFRKSLGYKKVSHWYCNDNKTIYCGTCMRTAVEDDNNIGILRACGNFRVFAQMDMAGLPNPSHKEAGSCIFPQIEYMDRLYRDSPNATWILPFRNTTDWLHSVMNWGPTHSKMGKRFERTCGWKEFSSENKTKAKQEEEVSQFICNHVKNL